MDRAHRNEPVLPAFDESANPVVGLLGKAHDVRSHVVDESGALDPLVVHQAEQLPRVASGSLDPRHIRMTRGHRDPRLRLQLLPGLDMDVTVEDPQGSLFCHAIFRYHRVSMAGKTRAFGVAAALVLCAWTALAAPRAPTAKPTPLPTPVPPPRELELRKGALSPGRQRFLSRDLTFSRLLRMEEVDLDRDGEMEFLVEGIGTVKRIPEDVVAIDFVSRLRLPFESPILAVLKRVGEEWKPLLLVHVPLRCGQSDDLGTCDQLIQFRSVRFRFDDRPQVVLQILHSGEAGTSASYTYRLEKGRLETTFSAALARSPVHVTI